MTTLITAAKETSIVVPTPRNYPVFKVSFTFQLKYRYVYYWRTACTCHGSKLTNSHVKQQLSFGRARDQVVLQKLVAGRRQFEAKNVFRSFELGGIRKHLMTGRRGKSEFCFPSALNVPLGFTLGNIASLRKKKFTVALGSLVSASLINLVPSVSNDGSKFKSSY